MRDFTYPEEVWVGRLRDGNCRTIGKDDFCGDHGIEE